MSLCLCLPSLPFDAELVTASAHSTARSSQCRVSCTIELVELPGGLAGIRIDRAVGCQRGRGKARGCSAEAVDSEAGVAHDE